MEFVVDRWSCEGIWLINDVCDCYVESLFFGIYIIVYFFFVIFVWEIYKWKRFGCFLNKINEFKKIFVLSLIILLLIMVY